MEEKKKHKIEVYDRKFNSDTGFFSKDNMLKTTGDLVDGIQMFVVAVFKLIVFAMYFVFQGLKIAMEGLFKKPKKNDGRTEHRRSKA